ncbi:hypothetical protein NQ314_006399 [Rhamnusium bicolor]|uniref:Uncharacterized protein n=1 Tax=Rhamnusium bicolor TaxID=1586634 RepID=A0AAV8Z4Q7_9CUCU|nr:hypothetical protein NQ314_006399 [Rhamnusium bicolor]
MEHYEDEVSSLDEESSLLNYESSSEKKSEDVNNDYDDDIEDNRSELKFDRGKFICITCSNLVY